MSEAQNRSRLELAREEIDRVFGPGHAAAHPELVAAVLNVGVIDWQARVLAAALQDIAVALAEGSIAVTGNSGLVAARGLVRP